MYEHTRQENKMIEKSDEKRVYLLIGPEGGFSEKEIELLKENKWVIDSLGKRKLRAETAAIVALYKVLNYFIN